MTNNNRYRLATPLVVMILVSFYGQLALADGNVGAGLNSRMSASARSGANPLPPSNPDKGISRLQSPQQNQIDVELFEKHGMQNLPLFLAAQAFGVTNVTFMSVISALVGNAPNPASFACIPDLRQNTTIGSAVYDKDPVIYFAFEFANTLDTPATFFWEMDQELPGLERFGNAQFQANLQAVDRNGDGATASAGGFLVTLQESVSHPGSVLNNIIPLGTGGFGNYELSADDQNPDDFTAMLNDTPFASVSNLNPVDGQGMNVEVTVSPGDMALFSGFFAVGDTNNALPTAQAAENVGNFLQAGNQYLRASIPEPAFGTWSFAWLLFLALRRFRHARSSTTGAH